MGIESKEPAREGWMVHPFRAALERVVGRIRVYLGGGERDDSDRSRGNYDRVGDQRSA
jgi:hypothetical protein